MNHHFNYIFSYRQSEFKLDSVKYELNDLEQLTYFTLTETWFTFL